MQGHRFDRDTGLYAGPVTLDDSDRDPQDRTRFLIPGDVTLHAPPPVGAAEIAVFIEGRWQVRPRPKPTWEQLRVAATACMALCDTVALRCFKRGVPFPSDWIAYDTALQAIIDAAEGDAAAVVLLTTPDIPAALRH